MQKYFEAPVMNIASFDTGDAIITTSDMHAVEDVTNQMNSMMSKVNKHGYSVHNIIKFDYNE